ncbi:MAG: DUF1841 family protein [Ectothiorhodospiraceae bacterium]|nr:DUF1841 family protein [Ectothiorhodospiraceae bacterium]MCH8504452.1 DUF1841 family protein [Ectothiorhodospiraceae bacterium]
MFSSDRDQLRRQYLLAWRKQQQGEPMTPLEAAIAQVVADHPEYHKLLSSEERALGREYLPEQGETNPFLHMGMHLALREQVHTNRPKGIRAVYQELVRVTGDPLEAEHLMMDSLAESLWLAQRDGVAPDERAYLKRLRKLVKRGL